MAIEFVTTRELTNKDGEIKGKIRIVKLKEQADALIEYTCPICDHAEKKKELWQEPLVTGSGINKKINFACAKCGHKITILKMKKETAKEKKKKR